MILFLRVRKSKNLSQTTQFVFYIVGRKSEITLMNNFSERKIFKIITNNFL